MLFKLIIFLSFLTTIFAQSSTTSSSQSDLTFTYTGFHSPPSNLTLDGFAQITHTGLLQLTNQTTQIKGHAFYTNPVTFKPSQNDTVVSFSTTFVFAILSEYSKLSGHGIAFFISPNRTLPNSLASQFLGLFDESNNGNTTNRVFAVELDTIQSKEFSDIDGNHVGIDINGLKSEKSVSARYYDDKSGGFVNFSMISGQPIQVWIDYDGFNKRISVSLAPININKPKNPTLSMIYDLSPIFLSSMFVGFSSSTGSVLSQHFVLGWSFKVNGIAPPLDLAKLPKLPRVRSNKVSGWLTTGLPLFLVVFVFTTAFVSVYVIRRKRKFAEELEDWELDYAPQRFRYKDLYYSTKGFKEKEVLGKGGFGRVYKGVLPNPKTEIAVKRVSHESRQGMREFVAEIVSIGRLRHRNLVPLLGYCRREGELLLVYDYMPNGSLDKYIYNQPEVTLNWKQRFKVIKGVASGLFYLHEEWEQVVVHRDVKASNVLLDGELNGRLGDFGLARLYDHGSDPQTTHVVGTLGYLAPEHTRTGKATRATDVFAFGAFLLEVCCGRRPMEICESSHDDDDTFLLVDWVFLHWKNGCILETKDPNLQGDCVDEEIELALKLGLLCSHSEPRARPTMRQVVQFLERDLPLPELTLLELSRNGLMFMNREGFSNFDVSYSSDMYKGFSHSSSIADSLLSGGR